VTTDRLAVGAIVGPQGIRGQFKVKLFAAATDALTRYGPLQIDDGRALQLAVKSVNSKGLVIVSAAGINSRDDAEALRGMLLTMPRASLPQLAEDEVYHADLLGAQVFHDDGRSLGTVVALYDFGAGDIIEVKPDKGPSVMLPFHGDSVVSVDIDNRRVVLAPPLGLLGELQDDETKPDQQPDHEDG